MFIPPHSSIYSTSTEQITLVIPNIWSKNQFGHSFHKINVLIHSFHRWSICNLYSYDTYILAIFMKIDMEIYEILLLWTRQHLFQYFYYHLAFTAFWAINSKENARFLVLLKKLQKCRRNHMFIRKYHMDI